MANLKEVRDRISSVNSTQQITKAMKMVSAAKLRRAQQAIVQLRPYSVKLNEMLGNILSNLGGEANTSFGIERPVTKVCMVIVTSNRGLCGAFNSNVIKAAVQKIETDYSEVRKKGGLTLLFVGKRGYDYFRKRYTDITFITDYTEVMPKLNFGITADISTMLMDSFEDKTYDAIDIVYAKFRNAAMQYFEVEPFLPVRKMESDVKEGESKYKADFIFEPNKEEILEHLVPSILKTQLHKTFLDTHASEHGARMTAMDAATENANDLLKELKLSYNKARQEAITSELSEIVGGAAALENG